MTEQHPLPTDPRFQDLNGRVFGKLTVLFYAGKKSGKYSLWHCRCECGRERTSDSSSLTLGRTTACLYCFRHRPKPGIRSDFKDLTGQTFGRLTVVSLERRTLTSRGSRAYWLCRCKCGESTVVRGDTLKDGNTVSCGCMVVAPSWHDEPIPETKHCSGCGRTLPFTLEHFNRHPSGKYGFLSRCRDCFKAEKKAAWARNGKRARERVLIHYGGDPPKCACCGEAHSEFLAVDHIDGGGAKHRREVGRNICPWLIRHGFPEGFRILCHNCNLALGLYGYCPHKGIKES